MAPRVPLVLVVAGAVLGGAGCSRDVHLGSIGDGPSDLLWSATFEPGNLSEWTGDGQGGTVAENPPNPPTVSTDVAHTGRYSGKATVIPAAGMDSLNYFYRVQPSPDAAYYGAWIYIAPGFTVGSWLSVIHFLGSQSADGSNPFAHWDVNLYPQPDGSLAAQLYNYVTTIDRQQTNPISVPIGQWVHFEVFLQKAFDATGQFKVWQDGVEILDAESVITTVGADWTEWSVGGASDNISPAPGLVYIDDATISVSRLGP